jgi:hypothetical protein
MHQGRADVGDDEIRLWQGRVGQQRQHRFQAAPGDVGEFDLGVGGDGLIKAQAIFGVASEKGSIQVGS